MPHEVALRDGTVVALRPIAPDDRDRLVAFHDALSAETARLRFFTPHPRLSSAELDRFTSVDHRDREALVVLSDEAIVGVGRYDRTVGTDAAEVAFVIADAWQGHGVATILLEELRARALTAGITEFFAETLGENHAMREVFAHSGMVTGTSWSGGTARVTMRLAAG